MSNLPTTIASESGRGDDIHDAAPGQVSGTDVSKQEPGASRRSPSQTKMGTFAGVFVPTTLNVISILLFLRFSFILGQSGVIGMLGMLIACYAINLLTTMSLSAIATNGTVRGGGAYYLISRSLGPEFGGSIGIVFYLGQVFTTGMNAVGLVQCLKENFGAESGHWLHFMPEGFAWEYLWATSVIVLCTAICMAGSSLFARCNNFLLIILLLATFSIPLSAIIVKPFEDRLRGLRYTGPSLQTLRDNLLPELTKGAAGSEMSGRETFQDLFGILFPATSGIFAGASMSGDLKHPSKAIPKGTLYGVLLTFATYSIIILSLGSSVSRASLHRDANIVSHINLSSSFILIGEVATAFFSVLMGLIGSARSLQAVARDGLIPGLSVFAYGTKNGDEPLFSTFLSVLGAQLVMLAPINEIASLVAMAYLMTFTVMNLACFLLKISSAPNFRPRFHYFNWYTAALGTILSGITMLFVDAFYASVCVGVLIIIFLIIHYTTPPKSWGDVSQSLIYHQVRKYLLRLREEHVKFWRPQILLLVNNPRRQYKLIQFCNSLKKGGLFILGHVIITKDFGSVVVEARRQQIAWTKYIDFSRIKAFINVAVSPGLEWGSRNIVLSGGLGGMRPNIVVLGAYNLDEYRRSRPLVNIGQKAGSQMSTPAQSPVRHEGKLRKRNTGTTVDALKGVLPTDTMRTEGATDVRKYMTVLEDLLFSVQINVAVAKGFADLDFPEDKPTMFEGLMRSLKQESSKGRESPRKFIDLWPLQMSAEINDEEGSEQRNILTTNFDTYALILQLGCILNTVPRWKQAFTLRVSVFVEYECDVEEERRRVKALLWNLRIEADVRVFWLASGDLQSYELIVNGNSENVTDKFKDDIDKSLRDEEWWQDIQGLRGKHSAATYAQQLAELHGDAGSTQSTPRSPFRRSWISSGLRPFPKLLEGIKRSRRHTTVSDLRDIGGMLGLSTHGPPSDLVLDSSSSSDDMFSSDEYDDNVTASFLGDHPALRGARSKRRLPIRAHTASGPPSDVSDNSPSRTPKSSHRRHHARQSSNRSIASDTGSLLRDSTSNLANVVVSSSTGSLPGGRQGRSTSRQQSRSKFSSKPTPNTTVSTEDGPGRSIMFTDSPTTAASQSRQSVYSNVAGPSKRHGASASTATIAEDVPGAESSDKDNRPVTPSASSAAHSRPLPHDPDDNPPQQQTPPRPKPTPTQPDPPPPSSSTKAGLGPNFPAQPSHPLSFMDLPCRAQYLILNELYRLYSPSSISSSSSSFSHTTTTTTTRENATANNNTKDGDGDGVGAGAGAGATVVIFTTLPSPLQGTHRSERDSVRYVEDLEVLTKGWAPTLLVHSNCVTVTMNL